MQTNNLSSKDIEEAKLLSKLSGRPAHVVADVFVWNGHLIDRATAVVALLKNNNQVPVSDSVKMRMQYNYNKKFQFYTDEPFLNVAADNDPATSARVWFNFVCRSVKTENTELPAEVLKSILVELHKN